MSNKRVVVKFTRSWRGYSKGELAGFDADQATALIDGKVAEMAKGAPAAAARKGGGSQSAGKGGPGQNAATNTSLPADKSSASETDGTPPGDDDADEPKP